MNFTTYCYTNTDSWNQAKLQQFQDFKNKIVYHKMQRYYGTIEKGSWYYGEELVIYYGIFNQDVEVGTPAYTWALKYENLDDWSQGMLNFKKESKYLEEVEENV